MENLIIIAVRARLEADKAEAMATLAIYNNAAVGVGEHPQVVDEAYKALKALDSAMSAIEALNSLSDQNQQNEEGE
tara:strand:+ start:1054 stop:1281 length:228 start_codon:yes stop_codon:yes gene_type:complete